MKRLVCDRCGFELTEKDDVEQAIEGQEAWAVALRERGLEPRGLIPCQHFVRCSGEMQMVSRNKVIKPD